MKFRSIQFSVAALAGAIVLSIVAALVLYAVYSGQRTQELVQTRTQQQFEAVIEQRLSALARTQVSEIQRGLEAPLLIARGLATSNAMLGMKDASGIPLLKIEREQLIALLKQTAVTNPLILGTYLGWEADALDHDDSRFIGTSITGVDNATGRFLPWWFRNDDGSLGLDKLADVNDQTVLATGVRASEYYLCSRESKKACVIDPAPYKVGDKVVMLASFVEPILIDGQFQGIAGADLSVNFIQELLNTADKQLYDGAGELALVSGNGRLVAFTKDPGKFGEKASDVLDASVASTLNQLSGENLHYEVNAKAGRIELYLPFKIGNTDARWTLLLELPLSAVMADVNRLQDELSAQRSTDLTGMTLVGLGIAALGLLVIWLLAHGIARPLRQMVAMLDDIAQGEGDLTRRLSSDRADELGSIAKGFNTFLAKLQAMISQVVVSVQKVSDSSEHTADIAIRTNQGVHKQMAEIDLVATAVHEMTATAQDVARNATHADQAAHQGLQIVRNTSNSISALAEEIGRAVGVVQTLARDSENINAILTAIRAIAEQTNLLALNAAIEAARAGEQGRGFAVVADEVRNLAQKTQQATEEIQQMIQQLQQGTRDVVRVMEDSQGKTDDSVQQAARAAEALESITQAVSVINDMNTQIASAAEEQSAVAEDINRNVINIGQVANEVAGGADESSNASAELTKLAEQQRRLINQFRV